ncbi:MAG TPA: hypothetical protein VGE21_05860 [Flavobacteriales bacterium]
MDPRTDLDRPETTPARRDDERPLPDPNGPAVDRDQRIDERAEEEARQESGLSASPERIGAEAEEEARAQEGSDDILPAT